MNRLRYTIEAKDQFGWFDYAILSDVNEAKKLAQDLKESFGNNIRLIDNQNMIEVQNDR